MWGTLICRNTKATSLLFSSPRPTVYNIYDIKKNVLAGWGPWYVESRKLYLLHLKTYIIFLKNVFNRWGTLNCRNTKTTSLLFSASRPTESNIYDIKNTKMTGGGPWYVETRKLRLCCPPSQGLNEPCSNTERCLWMRKDVFEYGKKTLCVHICLCVCVRGNTERRPCQYAKMCLLPWRYEKMSLLLSLWTNRLVSKRDIKSELNTERDLFGC